MSISRRISVTRFEPEALEYQARIVAAGGTIAGASLKAVSNFIAAAKAASIWSKLVDVGPFAGNQLAAALVKLKHLNGVQSSLTNQNFVGGDYTEATGLTGNGTTKYLRTGANLEDHVDAAFGTLAVYTRAVAPAADKRVLGTGETHLGTFVEAPTLEFQWGAGSAPVDATGGAAGFYAGVVQTPEQKQRIYHNANLVATSAGNAGLSGDGEVYVFADHDGLGVARKHWSGAVSFYAIAQWLTAAEVAALFGAVRTLQVALGRNV
jgi:hypothetical protein